MTHVVAAVFGEKEACLLAHLAYISNPCAFFSTLPPRRPEVDAGRRETCRCRAGTGRSRRSKDSTPRRRRQLELFCPVSFTAVTDNPGFVVSQMCGHCLCVSFLGREAAGNYGASFSGSGPAGPRTGRRPSSSRNPPVLYARVSEGNMACSSSQRRAADLIMPAIAPGGA
jgi:hypothetical protein